MPPRDDLLNLKCDVEDGVGYLLLEGQLLAESRHATEQVLRGWLEQGLDYVIVDCAALTRIDSGGLSTLLGALHRFRHQQGDVVLVRMNPELNALFELTSMERYFKIFPSVEQAREHQRDLNAQRVKGKSAT